MRRFVLAVLVCSAGCINMSALQTARVLPKGQGRMAIGGGYYKSPNIDQEASEATGEKESDIALPYFEIAYRHAILDQLEAGIKLSVGTYNADVKYQFIDEGPFAAAIGLGGA